jgi:tetratricopeptide (TPR) repeat protein
MVPLYISEQLFVDGIVALTAIVDAAREKKHMLLQMYRYFVGQLRSVAKHYHSSSQKNRPKAQQAKISAEYTRLRASVYLNEQMLSLANKNTCYWLVSLAQLYNYCKKHRQAVPLLKESIMLLREVRLNVLKVMRHHKNSIKMKASSADAVVPVKAINDSNGDSSAVATAQSTDSNGDAGIEEEEEEEGPPEVLVNAVERQLSFQTADVMIILSQSVFDEGKRVLGKRAKGLALPEHQFRHAMHLMNRAMDLYGAYELVMDNGKLIKEALRLKAKMSVEQSDYATAARCYDTINKLYMTIRFDDYKEVALYHFEHGKILLQAKEYNDAALLFQQSVEIYRSTYGVDHLDVRIAEGLLLRGEAYLHLKAYDYAEPPLDDALKMLSMIYLPEEASQSELLATCHGHLGAIYHYYEEYERALEAYNNSVTIYDNNADMSSSLKLANICNNLGTLLDDMVRCAWMDGWMDSGVDR